MENSEIKIYNTPDGKASNEVKLEKDTVWLSQKQMAELFDKDSDTIGLHLKNIYKSGELEEFSQTLYKQILNDLIELYYRDIAKSLKQELIKSLGYSDRSEITSMIQESYESTEASWQLASVIAMGRSADPKKWKSQIINMIMNSDAYYPVRIEAVKAAGELEISSARPILLQMFEEEREDVEMNFHIIWALSKIGGEGVREALVRRMEITEDKDEIWWF